AWLYLGSATAKKFWDDGKPEADLPFLRWGCEKALHEVESALLGVLENLPDRFAAGLLPLAIFPLGSRTLPASVALSASAARALQVDESDPRQVAQQPRGSLETESSRR